MKSLFLYIYKTYTLLDSKQVLLLIHCFLLRHRFGFMPNGGRVYYLNRSQPPLFIPMVMSYISHTNDTQFVRQHMSVLEQVCY